MDKVDNMATISKTARASMRGEVKKHYVKACPTDGKPMTATRIITKPRGMYWVCAQCGYREKL